MKNPHLNVGAALGIACLASCAAPMETRTTYVSVSSAMNKTSLSDQTFREVNSYRQNRNKQELVYHPGLAELAHRHAQYLLHSRQKEGLRNKDANHNGFESRVMRARFTMGFEQVAENVVACKGGSGSKFVRLWSQSRSHEHTMRDSYHYTGIGTVVDKDGTAFAVQMFATKNPYASSALARFETF